MKTPYIPHVFGNEVKQRLQTGRRWLTAGVASSIPWPLQDVCVTYAGDEYFLRGTEINGEKSPPCISIVCDDTQDHAINKIYRFTSVLGWFLGGYVDVSGYMSDSNPIIYGSRNVYSTVGIAGTKSFSCNHMPIIEHENVRKALAFWREGKRLSDIHDSYAFLSFYKVIESQFDNTKKEDKLAKVTWITENIEKLTDNAAKRVAQLRAEGVDVSKHLFESGRCAVAHASLDGEIVDPDIPSDRRRLSADLVIMEGLARQFISDKLDVPTAMDLYSTRNRLASWEAFLTVDPMQEGDEITANIERLIGKEISIGLWPDGPIFGLERMTTHIEAVQDDVVKIVLINERKTILLVFFLDFRNGRAHTNLEEGGLMHDNNSLTELDIRTYATFFYKVFANGIAELTIQGFEPVDCEVVIPTNMFMRTSVEEAIEQEVSRFQAGLKGKPNAVAE